MKIMKGERPPHITMKEATKLRSALSICSVVDRNRHDRSNDQNSSTLNQTSIRSFFIKAPKTNKRPVSAISGISTQISDDVSKTLSPALNIAKDSAEHQNKCHSSTTPSPVNISIDNCCADQALHDSTKSYTNTDHQSSSLSSTKSTSLMIQKLKPSHPPPPQQQLYIDFGQRNFAATIVCPICGMLYVHGVPSDIKQHEKICHNYQHGVSWPLTTLGSKRSTYHPHPNKSQSLPQERICYEWTLPKIKTKIMKSRESVSKRLPLSTTTTKCSNSHRTFDELHTATIVEVGNFSRSFYH